MKIFRTLVITSAISLCALGALSAHAQAPATPAPVALMTEKKVFTMPSYTTFGGKIIKNVKEATTRSRETFENDEDSHCCFGVDSFIFDIFCDLLFALF